MSSTSEVDNRGGQLAELEKNATQIMIFFPHCMWAENNKVIMLVHHRVDLVCLSAALTWYVVHNVKITNFIGLTFSFVSKLSSHMRLKDYYIQEND